MEFPQNKVSGFHVLRLNFHGNQCNIFCCSFKQLDFFSFCVETLKWQNQSPWGVLQKRCFPLNFIYFSEHTFSWAHMNCCFWIYKLQLKTCVRPLFFIKFLFFHQMIGLQKLWKMFFISSKKLFLFLRYSNFCNFFSSLLKFYPVCFHCILCWWLSK